MSMCLHVYVHSLWLAVSKVQAVPAVAQPPTSAAVAYSWAGFHLHGAGTSYAVNTIMMISECLLKSSAFCV